MEAQAIQINEALESFFKEETGEYVEYMESMLYDWYQHYAREHYRTEHIDKVVNAAFRVNDLLMKLIDAVQASEESHDPLFIP